MVRTIMSYNVLKISFGIFQPQYAHSNAIREILNFQHMYMYCVRLIIMYADIHSMHFLYN